MKKQDWIEYISYLRRSISKENNKLVKNKRQECIKNYNLMNLHLDINDAKVKLRGISKGRS